MKRLLLAGLIAAIVLFGFAGLINAKQNPASSIFTQQTASQNNVQPISNLNSFFNSVSTSAGNNLQMSASSNLPHITLTASGNFNPGGVVILDVIGSPLMANFPFIIVFSLRGDYPGLNFPGVGTIPVNPPYLASFFGILDASGNGHFIIQIPYDPSLIGLPLTSAVVSMDPFITGNFILSNPVSFEVGRGLSGVACCTEGVLNGPESQCLSGGVSINYCRLNAEGAVQNCIPQDIGVDPPPANVSSLQPGNSTAGSSFLANLTRDIGLSNITRRVYDNVTYDCDDFADDLEQWLQGLGYNATYTQFVKYVGNTSTIDYIHAVIDVHLPDGTIVWIEPQTGAIINLDFDGDGQVEANVNMPYRNGHHPTDDNAKIYVYDSAATAAANGAPRD